MKRTIILTMIIGLLILSACSDNNENSSISSTNEINNSDTNETGRQQSVSTTPEEFEEADFNTLVLFTFLLEDTEIAIEAEQAQDMLVLWQVGKTIQN